MVFPACLVAPPAARRVARICQLWPEGAFCHVLELRLDGQGEPVDASQAYVASDLPWLATRSRDQPVMRQLHTFLDWASVSRPRAISLEWDLDTSDSDQPNCPGAFFSTKGPATVDSTEYLIGGLTALNRDELVEPVLAALRACAPEARLRQVGVLLSRPDAGVRLVLDCGSAEAARIAMHRLVPSALPSLEVLLALPGFEAAPRLALDVLTSGIGPRISIEFGDARTTGPQIAACIDGLIRLGLVDTAAARALRERVDWSSVDHRLMTGLSHLKASVDGTDRPRIKAYQAVLVRPDATAA
jgi:hypothetical protein